MSADNTTEADKKFDIGNAFVMTDADDAKAEKVEAIIKDAGDISTANKIKLLEEAGFDDAFSTSCCAFDFIEGGGKTTTGFCDGADRIAVGGEDGKTMVFWADGAGMEGFE